MSNLIERLRKWGEGESLAHHFLGTKSARQDCAEAAAALVEAQAEIARLREALEMSREGWDNALELGLLPKQHRHSAKTMANVARAALSRPHATKGDEG